MQRYFKIDIVFEAHNKKDAKAIEEITAQTVNDETLSCNRYRQAVYYGIYKA